MLCNNPNAFSSTGFASKAVPVNGRPSEKNPNVNQPVNNTLSSQPSKEVSVEKSFKVEEEEAAKPKLTETRKVKLPAVTDGQHRKHDVLIKLHITFLQVF